MPTTLSESLSPRGVPQTSTSSSLAPSLEATPEPRRIPSELELKASYAPLMTYCAMGVTRLWHGGPRRDGVQERAIPEVAERDEEDDAHGLERRLAGLCQVGHRIELVGGFDCGRDPLAVGEAVLTRDDHESALFDAEQDFGAQK